MATEAVAMSGHLYCTVDFRYLEHISDIALVRSRGCCAGCGVALVLVLVLALVRVEALTAGSGYFAFSLVRRAPQAEQA